MNVEKGAIWWMGYVNHSTSGRPSNSARLVEEGTALRECKDPSAQNWIFDGFNPRERQ
jgi:hypothetical protein